MVMPSFRWMIALLRLGWVSLLPQGVYAFGAAGSHQPRCRTLLIVREGTCFRKGRQFWCGAGKQAARGEQLHYLNDR